jgi:hypothetical protein
MKKSNLPIMEKALEGYQKDVQKLQDKEAIKFLEKAEKQMSEFKKMKKETPKQKCNKEFIAMIDEKLEQISKRPKYSEQKSEDEVCLLALRDLAESNLK